MIQSIRQFLRVERPSTRKPCVPAGERIYAIGDIHGRRDLFDALREAIEEDDRQAAPARSTVILLGDLVDRGPDSAGVIASARKWRAKRVVRCLAGNHEEMFLRSFDDVEMLRHFLRHGGRETILSFGIGRELYNSLSLEELQVEMARIVPSEVCEFLENFEEMIIAGDYAFVHAGIDPQRPIDDQCRSDLLWIRERFLRHDEPLSHIIVHGHTISEDIEYAGFRVGIDTGAYRSGRLTALVLEGSARRTIQAVENEGIVSIVKSRGN